MYAFFKKEIKMEINIDSVRINYFDNKRENAPSVLLLHGWGSNIKLFNNIIELLSDKYRVVAPDMPGFGESDEPPCPWCVDDYVQFVKKFCYCINLKPDVMLGHSFGGRVIIKSTSGNSPIFNPTKIVLTDSAGIKPKQSFGSWLKLRGYKIGKWFMSLPPLKKAFPNAVDNMRRKRGSADYLAASPVMRQTLVRVVNEDLRKLLPGIKQSVLLIWGEKDDATPVSDAKLMEKLLPDAGTVIIENAGHYSFLDGWYTYSRVLTSFLLDNN